MSKVQMTCIGFFVMASFTLASRSVEAQAVVNKTNKSVAPANGAAASGAFRTLPSRP
ncbi:MAG: hypothetical protein JO266_18285, partial [Acidobacteria bacterium]|nr:hypothetical protein [Acidobacteriota bacterium]MBV9905047.1 hypothetical protein [Alphaproteobacteria bacterium]